jgi:hypothetical protein
MFLPASTAEALYGADPTAFKVNPYALNPVDDDFRPVSTVAAPRAA